MSGFVSEQQYLIYRPYFVHYNFLSTGEAKNQVVKPKALPSTHQFFDASNE